MRTASLAPMSRGVRGPDTRTWDPADDGIVVVDKPQGWTSHDVVKKMRWLARTKKVGHAGTLDPMATGVLVVGIGRATRLLTYIVGESKMYEATIRLGQDTITDDAEGDVTATLGASSVTAGLLAPHIAALTGEIQQVPSSVSAIKVDGKRSYARVRAGEDVALAARPVTVHRFDVGGIRHVVADDGTAVADVDVVVECSSGTYIRALARDLGTALGTGGHLTALRRTSVGRFDLSQSAGLDALEADAIRNGRISPMLLADSAEAVMPVRNLTDSDAVELSFGRNLPATGTRGVHAALTQDRELIALVDDGRVRGEMKARPVMVFSPQILTGPATQV